jgi:undecaprenyl-diphosphatase
MLEHLKILDTHLFLFFNHTLSNPVFDAVFVTITNGRFWIIPGIIGAGLFIFFKRKTAFLVIALSLITVGVSDPVCNRIIKPHFHRLRPCNEKVDIPGGNFLLGRKTSASFPSSHAMNMFAQAMLFALLYRKKKVAITAFVFAAIISFSRIYVGAHYPLDVFCGALFGVVCGWLVYGLFAEIRKRFFEHKIELPLR